MDFDKLIVALASSEAKETLSAKPASQRVSQMLNLRNVMKGLPAVRKALQGCRAQLLKIICDVSCQCCCFREDDGWADE
jgi:DNA mismatch repair protein MSH4